ncbi:MAG: hypothetical protein ACM34I_10625 [bacterium]
MKKYRPLSLKKVRRYSLKTRKSKVEVSLASGTHEKGGSFADFLDTLPDILAARDIVAVADAVVTARKNQRPVILAMGAHPIKVGLSPIIIDLIQGGVITAVAANGAAIIHDFELAFIGMTSEDVAPELATGAFGMAEETGRFINIAIKNGVRKGLGIGSAIGEYIARGKAFRHRDKSIFAAAYDRGIPVTVHVAVGTDIIHMHPEADGSAIGEGSMRDFRLLASVVSDLEGGVFINLGSAVIIPEVFLKALTIARNLGHRVDAITTVTLDFIRQYRALENVCKRPTMKGGRSYFITGHHEINLPLLAAIIKERMT